MSDALIVYETIAREAGTIDQKIAVSRLILTRAKLGLRYKWGTTPRSVCLYPGAFDCWNSQTHASQDERTQEELEQAMKAFEIACTTKSDFPATHYHDKRQEKHTGIFKDMKFLCTVDKDMHFYQEIR